MKSQITVQAALASSSSHLAVSVTLNSLQLLSLREHQAGSSGVTPRKA